MTRVEAPGSHAVVDPVFLRLGAPVPFVHAGGILR
jgi:hypothetical protein